MKNTGGGGTGIANIGHPPLVNPKAGSGGSGIVLIRHPV
jgi:hypothetical protein